MHSVILNGKNYISSRRAAKLCTYTTDYVGQLCRSGKLDCTRVGRVWYVTEESVLKHKQNADESFAATRKFDSIKPLKEVEAKKIPESWSEVRQTNALHH